MVALMPSVRAALLSAGILVTFPHAAQSSERTACRRLFPYGSSNPRAGSEHGGESPGTRNPLQFVRSAVLENEG